ncbi:MAG: hypothetical protein IPL61_01385 [Myxococcales bacterium]|nr:hypothetical protein [Myxococcales bacterium]
MNFFGHAAVASWHSAEPGVALGAMLPDFATMCGARLGPQDDAAIAAGVDLHHATDAAFHRAPVVVGLFREAEARLTARGVRRGPTRACAHVGVELLLDGVLLPEPAYQRAFRAGLDHDGAVAWHDPEGADRFVALRARLRDHAPPTDLGSGGGVARRLIRILAGRPLLAPTAAEHGPIALALDELVARVAAAAPTVLTQVRAAMAQARTPAAR